MEKGGGWDVSVVVGMRFPHYTDTHSSGINALRDSQRTKREGHHIKKT